MSDVSPPSAPGHHAQVRGVATVEVDTRRVVRYGGLACIVVLIVVVVLTTISAANQNARSDRLRREGIPVTVTITSCFGVASGTGITEVAYNCRGTYALDGRQYNEPIRGTTSLHTPGDTLDAVAVRGEPALVSTADAVAKGSSSFGPYVTPTVLGAVTVVLAVGLFFWAKRHPLDRGRGRGRGRGDGGAGGAGAGGGETPAGALPS